MASKTFALFLDRLADLDEHFTAEVNDLLAILAADCKRRPTVGASRTLTIKLELRPATGDPEDVEITPKVSPSIPAGGAHRVRVARVSKSGQLMLDFVGDVDGTNET